MEGHKSIDSIEVERLLATGALKRIGMGSRRACYRMPDGRSCLKCYRSDAEIEEGRYPGALPVKPLASGAVREIRSCRFDERRNTCCQEYRYWLSLRNRLPADLMSAFPSYIVQIRLPSRGWAIIEEFVENDDGTLIRKFADEWRDSDVQRQSELCAAIKSFAGALAEHAVRFFDPQTIFVQRVEGNSFRLRIADFEPASRTLIPIDRLVPSLVAMKVRRRFRKYLIRENIAIPADTNQSTGAEKVNILCLKWGQDYGPEYINRLYFGVRRFLSRPFRFVCVTDDPTGLVEGVDAVPFPAPPPGWKAEWPNIFIKLCVFQDGFADLSGPTLFLDIDQVIMGPLDRFFDYRPGEFCIIHNWIEFRKSLLRKRPKIGNSSCFRFEAGRMNRVYERFLAEQDRARDVSQFRTEQAYMTHAVGIENVNWWPKNWVMSFKRACTWPFPLNLLFRPRMAKNTSILCFHGHPSPNEAVAGYPGKRHHPEQRTLPAPWVERLWIGGATEGQKA